MGLNEYRLADFVISDLFFLASVLACLIVLLRGKPSYLSRNRSTRNPSVFRLGAYILLTGAIVSTFRSVDPLESLVTILRLAWVVLALSWLLRLVVSNRRALIWAVGALKLSVLVSSFAAILGNAGLLNLGAIDNDRQTAFFTHPNQLGTFLAMGLPFFLLQTQPTKRLKFIGPWFRRLGAIAVVGAAITTTGSMVNTSGAMLGSILTVALAAVLRGPRQRPPRPLSIMATAVVVALGLVIFVQSDSQVAERFTNWRGGDADTRSSVESRSNFNDAVLERLPDRLVIGVGVDRESTELDFGKIESGYNHNMYLRFLNGVGLPALTGLLLMLVVTVQMALRLAANTGGTELNPIAIALAGSIMTGMYTNLFQPAGYERFFWFPVLLTGALWQLRRSELLQLQRTPAGPDGAGLDSGAEIRSVTSP